MTANEARNKVTSLTIIIPFLKETSTDLFEGTLVSILENRPADAGVLVINAAEYDNRYGISADDGVTFVPADSAISLIDAVNQGVQVAATPFVHPLLSGCQVEEGWTVPALARFADPSVASVIPAVRTEGAASIFSRGLAFSPDGLLCRLTAETPIPANSIAAPFIDGAFFRRESVLSLGLFLSAFGSFAYTDTALLLNALNQKTVFEKDSILLYGEGVIPELSRETWITAQEQLYQRWSDFFGSEAKRIHGSRVRREKWSAFFHGTGSLIRGAYKKGQIPLPVPSRKKILAAAKSAPAASEIS